MEVLSKSLLALEKFYPHEVIIMVQLEGKKNNISEGNFGFVQVYPSYDTVLVNSNDKSAYFVHPNIMRVTGRGVQSSKVKLGQTALMPPEINIKSSK